jgi:hypothetical protein
MLKFKITALTLAAFTGLTFITWASDVPSTPASPTPGTNAIATTNGAPPLRKLPPKQADAASKTAEFGKVAKTDETYKSALDAHAIADAVKLVDKDGAFKGTVAKIFEPRGLAIVEFDANYRSALTAILRGTNFSKFPALTNLVGKDVLMTGKFIKYRDSAEIVLEDPKQVKVVQGDAKQ